MDSRDQGGEGGIKSRLQEVTGGSGIVVQRNISTEADTERGRGEEVEDVFERGVCLALHSLSIGDYCCARW